MLESATAGGQPRAGAFKILEWPDGIQPNPTTLVGIVKIHKYRKARVHRFQQAKTTPTDISDFLL
jgi:hypothetical protein